MLLHKSIVFDRVLKDLQSAVFFFLVLNSCVLYEIYEFTLLENKPHLNKSCILLHKLKEHHDIDVIIGPFIIKFFLI
jgi:hypothetical protein